jgi:hypothetical protein
MDPDGNFQIGHVDEHKPLDFYLDDRALLVDGFHHGQDICAAFDAVIDGYAIDEDALDRWIAEKFVSSTNHAAFPKIPST